jgi:3-methyl-2-oxobutanoate hydroxymethyltransferase
MNDKPTYVATSAKKSVTVPGLRARRIGGPAITMLTCYDAAFARVLDQCGVDVLLVGDSLGMVLQGHRSTLPVTLSDIAYHTECVARADVNSLIIADMPFGSYQESCEQAYRNAATLLAAGAQMVKLEGGEWLVPTVEFLATRSVPVCAHVGLTPQSINALGSYRVQGRDEQSAQQLLRDAQALERAGADMLVVELIPSSLGRRLTESLTIPTIGIGAGPHTTGQVLVLHDMLGINSGKSPRFVKNFMSSTGSVVGAVQAYVAEVRAGTFPAEEHSFGDVVDLSRAVSA